MSTVNAELRTLRILGVALVLGLIHAVVDGSCVATLTEQGVLAEGYQTAEAFLSRPGDAVWEWYVLYNVLAFGTQFSIGAVADRATAYRITAILALGMVAGAVVIGSGAPVAAVALAGLGNAAFHVGAGAIVLRMSPNRAAAAGLFVAPGAIGLAAGKWAGDGLDWWAPLALGLLATGAAAVWLLGGPAVSRDREKPHPVAIGQPLLAVCLVVLLLSIAVRSFGGSIVPSFYGGNIAVLAGLAFAAFGGKALGGLVADGLGWVLVSIVALLGAAPLLSYYVEQSSLAITGMVLFQMTMPVTLMAVYRVFPDEPAFAFGLTTLALLVGALPAFVFPIAWFAAPGTLLALILVSAAALAIGLPPVLRTRAFPVK